MRETIAVFDPEELSTWHMPADIDLDEALRPRFHEACAALRSVLTGSLNLTRASETHGLCRKRLKAMIERAPQIARDGLPYGFRVCVPWGTYSKGANTKLDQEMPRIAGPHAMHQLLLAQPTVAKLIDEFGTPLPPGKPPAAFGRLHAKIVKTLTAQELELYYPLNQQDKGRQALLRFLRARRLNNAAAGNLETEAAPTSTLSELFLNSPFSRVETDAHRIDIEAVLGVPLPNGGMVKRAITTMWLLVTIERKSRAILSWTLRVGRSYNNLDLAICIGKALMPWARRELTIPGLEYAPGAGMPAGELGDRSSWRANSVALDNAMAHYAIEFEQAFCRGHGGVLVYGRAHTPRSRPIVEQLFSRLERGALRLIPGGFEPATRLSDNKIRISNFAPGDAPIQLHLFEELLDVIIANYNATPHSSLGNLTPLQHLQIRPQRAFDFVPDTGEADAANMTSAIVPLVVHGNKKQGVPPHVNYMYTRYRSRDLDERWELIGRTVLGRVNRLDLRTMMLMRTPTAPICVVRAAAPWNVTIHDETTRGLIMQWSKLRAGFSIVGVPCAVGAYTSFLRSLAPSSPAAVDQLARMEQIYNGRPPTATSRNMSAPLKRPSRGWISLDGGVGLQPGGRGDDEG